MRLPPARPLLILAVLAVTAVAVWATPLEPNARILVRRAAISWVPPEGWEALTPQELGIGAMELRVNQQACFPRFRGPGVEVTVEVDQAEPNETLAQYTDRRLAQATASRFLYLAVNREHMVRGVGCYRAIINFSTPISNGAATSQLLRYFFANRRGEVVTVTAKTQNKAAMEAFARAFENSLELHRL